MAKITIGNSYDNSKASISAEFSKSSAMELNIGDQYDMSVRDISLVEREAANVNAEVARLRQLLANLEKTHGASPAWKAVRDQASAVADSATQVVAEHRWYSISAKGLVEAAKAVGEAASPLVGSALKVIELLQKAKA